MQCSWFRVLEGFQGQSFKGILAGSSVVISGVISEVVILLTPYKGPYNPLITTHEPPSRP